MSFFQEDTRAKPTDLASRIGAVIGNILVGLTYLLILFPVAYSFLR